MRVYRKARDIYKFEDSFFSSTGDVTFPNLHNVRVFVQKINQKRDLINFPEMAARGSEINGIALENEIFRHLFDIYQDQNNIDLAADLPRWLSEEIGAEELESTLKFLLEEFPPPTIYNGETNIDSYLEQETDGTPNRYIAISCMIDLWLSNENPAFSSNLELFNDSDLEKKSKYSEIITKITEFFDVQPPFGPDNQNFIEMLQSLAIKEPYSIKGQLEYINETWGSLITPFRFKILLALDFFKEEEKLRGLGPGEAQIYEYDYLEENYTPDKDWMPKAVMIAKNIYVWLDQLSKKYKANLHRIDHIPDEELTQLSNWGFNALWLIGIWERSSASKTIKRWCGNPEAEASAYSLYDYVIAQDLGGQPAFENLKERAWKRGIRLASDMVPNHTGIDSKWMIEHPDWYISLPYSPFPVYSYSGESLSRNPRIGIKLEDHYFSRTDAAVTFKWEDYETKEVRYMYHGNDGTSMAWNDTAQLNFLKPEVREAVIQTILHVARMFSIIRFDAAMTLTKKHYQRLWFPAPGSGGDIPSRAEHGLSKQQFDKAMPKEFWREVVDRINQEAPDTLLIAEAFWLLEGFFVRTLGMHRVYNSAFMNMLRDEDNAKYRSVIKNTLEYDPEILKRFVNFMNNPDEKTAADQFGKGKKYFGICLLLVTMPGLPMFGHGQIEGFKEKYGMEYRRAYWDEKVDEGFVQYHNQIILPLLKKRYLFAEVENFLLYDYYTSQGFVNEDVYAYSNSEGNEKALVVYHNRFSSTSGWIKTSAAFAIKKKDQTQLIQKTLGNSLTLHNDEDYYCIFRDHIRGLEYIRRSKEIYDKGLYLELEAYQSAVFLDFREVQDSEYQHYALLHDFLSGKGVDNIDETLQELVYHSLHKVFKELVNKPIFEAIIKAQESSYQEEKDKILDEVNSKFSEFLKEVAKFSKSETVGSDIVEEITNKLNNLFHLKESVNRLTLSPEISDKFLGYFNENYPEDWKIILSWLFIHLLGKIKSPTHYELQSRSWIDEWGLGRIIEWTLKGFEETQPSASEALILIKILTSHQKWYNRRKETDYQPVQIMRKLMTDLEVQSYIQTNRYHNILWFNQEAFENLIKWLFIISTIEIFSTTKEKNIAKELERIFTIIDQWLFAAERSNYQVENLFDLLRGNE
ncbi:MAG: alpha-amylase [Candidatus Heimdallarchaeota archaeon]|nr:MAG: alpha-amylase [Candidatus Heimdallarchaeota archaeon]